MTASLSGVGTANAGHIRPKSEVQPNLRFFFIYLAKSLEISRFRNKHNRLVLPCFKGLTSPFFAFDHMFDHLRRFLHLSQIYLLFIYKNVRCNIVTSHKVELLF